MFQMNNMTPKDGAFHTMRRVAGDMDLGELVRAGLVTVVVAGRRTSVSSIHFHGESDRTEPGALIVATGATGSGEQVRVVEAADVAQAGVVVLRHVATVDVEERCRDLGVTLAVLDAAVEWSQLVWFVRSVLDRGQAVGPELAAQQGLFAMADAIASLLNAPVTIEDVHSRVVAYSATNDGADPARTSTIMSRAVPPDVLRRLRASGALKKLTHESRPFIVPGREPGFLQRLVVPLRIGGQAVGSIWAIWDGQLDAQLETQLIATGTAAALGLVQLNAGLDAAGRYSLEAIRMALRDGATPAPGAFELPFRPVRVVALQRLSSTDPADDVAVWRTYFRKKSWADPMLADVEGSAFVIVPERSGPGGWPWLRRLARGAAPGRIGASGPRSDIAELPGARGEATETLAAVSALEVGGAAYEEVWDTVTLRRATAAVESVEHEQLRHLHRQEPVLAATLRMWLEQGADIRAAAVAMHLHPNTVRHRLKKIDQYVGAALQTPRQRLAAVILLHGWDDAQVASSTVP